MAGIRITELNTGGNVSSTDQIPVARDTITTLRIPANQFVVNANNTGDGSGLLFVDKTTSAGTVLNFRTIKVENNLSLSTQGNTITISASGQDPTKTAFNGNGTTTTWALNGANSSNPSNYRVTIDGVVQEPLVDFTISIPNITFTTPPPNLSRVVVISNNLVNVYNNVPSDGVVTPTKLSLGGLNWDTSGNVGIGTSTPFNTEGKALHVYTNAPNTGTAANAKVRIESANRNATLELVGNGPGAVGQVIFGTDTEFAGSVLGDLNNRSLFFRTSGHAAECEKMRITASGDVGIGTSFPVTGFGKPSLHLYNNINGGTAATSNAYMAIQSVNRNATLELVGSGAAGSVGQLNFGATPGSAVAGIAGDIANQAIVFRTGNNTEKVRINSSGSVGIGTSSPTVPLDVVGSIRAGGATGDISAEGNSYPFVQVKNTAAPLNKKYFRIGVGTGGFVTFERVNDAYTSGSPAFNIDTSNVINTQGNPITTCPTTAKAWVRFSQSGAILDAYNVSTVTNFGTSSSAYRVTFTNAMPNTNYVVVACPNVGGAAGPGDDNVLGTNGSIETTYFDLVCSDFNNGGTGIVAEQISIGMVIVFGD